MNRRELFGRALALQAIVWWPGMARATVVDDIWRDAKRGRDVALRIRWPDGSAPFALVIHSHGLGGSREGGDVWGEAWRQAGFAVIHVQHPGSDAEVARQGLTALRRAASGEQLRERVADVKFLLDEIERRAQAGESGWARVRLDALGMSGHSFGAHTVQALAGQRFPVAAEAVVDLRFKAFIAFSPSPGQTANAFGGVTRPFLAATGSLDDDPLRKSMTAEDRASVYDAMPPGRRALLWLADADHATFGGNSKPRTRRRIGPGSRERSVVALEPAHQALLSAVTTQWWRAYLLGDTAALAALRQPAGLGEGDRWRND